MSRPPPQPADGVLALHTLLGEVRAICEPLGARPALARAKALAERLATAP